MEYRVLARKYRPQRFADLIGQEVLVRTLQNALASGRIAHAFILTGIRGIGKTTTARIIARALNCVGPDGTLPSASEPCGVCASCVAIGQGKHMDVVEMDAASHTSVEDVRDIIGKVQYLPNDARMKVFIIDEVHMLSINAFNALLKTLEEPPEHVKFIFATTELRKIPVTILSRCQRFDLKRIEPALLASHLRGIALKEQVEVEEEALVLIASAAEGSVRDALSLLDQAIALCAVEREGAVEKGGAVEGGGAAEKRGAGEKGESVKVRAQIVREMLGVSDKSQLFDLLEYVTQGRMQEALALFRQYHQAGADPVTLLQDLMGIAHFITRLKLARPDAPDPAFSTSEAERAEVFAGALGVPALARLWQMLLKGLQEARVAPDPVAAAEMILVRIVYSADLPPPAELIRKLREEGDGAKALPSVAPHGGTHGVNPPARPVLSLISGAQAVEAPRAVPAPDFAPLPSSFAEAAALFRQRGEMILYHAICEQMRPVRFERGRIEISVEADLPSDYPNRLARHLSDWTGERWIVMLSNDQGGASLAEREAQAQREACAQAGAHPFVAAISAHFPGAEVVKVIENKQIETSGEKA